MAGKIRKMIDAIITKKAGGNPTLVHITKTKMLVKGINPDSYTAQSEDDAEVIRKLDAIAKEFGIKL